MKSNTKHKIRLTIDNDFKVVMEGYGLETMLIELRKKILEYKKQLKEKNDEEA